MDALISTFHIEWHAIVAQAINFVIVFAVLYLAAFKPLRKLMDERRDTIAGGLEDAKMQKKILEDAQEILANTHKEVLVIANDSKKALAKDMEKQKEKSMAEIKTLVEEYRVKGTKDMLAEKDAMLKDAEKEVADLVLRVVTKVLEENTTPSINRAIVEENIKKLKS